MRGGTVDEMTEAKIEMDRTERKRTGKSCQSYSKDGDSGLVMQGEKKWRKIRARWGMWDGRRAYVPCFARSPPCIPGGRAPRPRHLGLFQVVKA